MSWIARKSKSILSLKAYVENPDYAAQKTTPGVVIQA